MNFKKALMVASLVVSFSTSAIAGHLAYQNVKMDAKLRSLEQQITNVNKQMITLRRDKTQLVYGLIVNQTPAQGVNYQEERGGQVTATFNKDGLQYRVQTLRNGGLKTTAFEKRGTFVTTDDFMPTEISDGIVDAAMFVKDDVSETYVNLETSQSFQGRNNQSLKGVAQAKHERALDLTLGLYLP